MYEIQSINHLDKVALMLSTFQNKPRMTNFVLSFAEQSEDLEVMFRQLLEERSLDTSSGVQLDAIGTIIGEARLGRDDAEYLLALRIRIAINSSSGTVRDIIEVTRLVLAQPDIDIIVNRVAPAVISMYVGTEDTLDELRAILEQTIAAGVRLEDIFYPSDRLPLIFTEEGGGGVEGILPEEGSNNIADRVFVEEL
jgi:hypothetical protein